MSEEKFNTGLTDSERELLAVLAEECGEAIQIIGKILRHGYESYNPTIKDSPTNREMLEKEVGDILAAQVMLETSGALCRSKITVFASQKLESVKQWLHF